MREGCEGAWELGDVSVVMRGGVHFPKIFENASCGGAAAWSVLITAAGVVMVVR